MKTLCTAAKSAYESIKMSNSNIGGVYVVTSTELGWDCVVGVFDEDSVDLEELENTFPEGGEYVITFRMVEKSLGAYK